MNAAQPKKAPIKHLLAVGPLPPPPSGSNVSFQVFCEHLHQYTDVERLSIIDSSPKRIKQNTGIVTWHNGQQAIRQTWLFWRKGPRADCILIFGSNQFLLSLTPLLVFSARLLGKPCFVRSFGGSLDQFEANLHPVARKVLRWGLAQSAGLFVETQLLHRHFLKILGPKVHHVTAYRPLPTIPNKVSTPRRNQAHGSRLRLVFISWIRAEKGVSVLLRALRSLAPEEQAGVCCDLYGPIVDEYRHELYSEIAQTPCASYEGVLDNADVVEKLRNYDVLVFPTFYQGEGYPGIIVEAMIAGLPVVTTRFRSIPDMVENRVNGLLVEPHDSAALAAAVRTLLGDRSLLAHMSSENFKRRQQYAVSSVLPQMVSIMASQQR